MSLINKRTLIVVGSSTAIGFLGDVMTYSVAASKGSKFRFIVPKGKELASVLFLGVVGGFVIDYALKQIELSLKTKQERLLDTLVEQEKAKLESGVNINKNPTGVIWA